LSASTPISVPSLSSWVETIMKPRTLRCIMHRD
jgi:hypothetical protein